MQREPEALGAPNETTPFPSVHLTPGRRVKSPRSLDFRWCAPPFPTLTIKIIVKVTVSACHPLFKTLITSKCPNNRHSSPQDCHPHFALWTVRQSTLYLAVWFSFPYLVSYIPSGKLYISLIYCSSVSFPLEYQLYKSKVFSPLFLSFILLYANILKWGLTKFFSSDQIVSILGFSPHTISVDYPFFNL